MTTPIDPFERRLPRAFTDLAEARTPDYLIDILGQTARTRQRPAWAIPGRWNPMLNLTHRPAFALLTVVLLAVALGGGFLLMQGNQSSVGGPATPTPAASPSPSPVTLTTQDAGRPIAAGTTYRVGTPFGLPFQLTPAEDWRVDRLVTGEFIMYSDPDREAYVLVDLIEDVSTDPCHDTTEPVASPRPSSVDEIVGALGAMESFTVGETTDIEIDGHAGKEFDLSNSLDPDTAACEGEMLIPIWTYRGGAKTSTNPGTTGEHIAVIDVDGTLVAIGWTSTPGGPADQLVRNLDFE